MFPAGQMTALVGASGGGKSTVMNLIMRLYDPDSGRVLFDGEDIKHATLHSLRDKIAYVSQDTFLFSGTVMHNIRMGRQDATDEEVIEAAKAANAHDFIMATPEGYETLIGENGVLPVGRPAPAAVDRARHAAAARRSCCSTKRRARSTPNPRRCSATRWNTSRRAARRSPSRTACRPCTRPTTSS